MVLILRHICKEQEVVYRRDKVRAHFSRELVVVFWLVLLEGFLNRKLEADSILDFFLGLLSLGHISMGLVGFMHNKERQLWVILFKECVVTEVVVGRELSKTASVQLANRPLVSGILGMEE